MRIDILTLFPEMFEEPLSSGVFGRAVAKGLVRVNLYNIRNYSHDKHGTVDDYPYGGGAGMVLKPEPIFEAVEQIRQESEEEELPIILLTPQGRLFSQAVAVTLSRYRHLVLICGHYEGVDERVGQHLATDEISIGDYILSGGELAAMVVADAVVRLLPGVLGSADSLKEGSHSAGRLQYPQYTRPAVYRGLAVPRVLLSGNHRQVAKWRHQQSIRRTLERRPELLDKVSLSPEERKLLSQPTKTPSQDRG